MDRIASLMNFLKDSPNDSFLQHALALEYIKSGDDAAAKKMFVRILENDPGYVGSYYHLAKLHERLGETDEAIAVYEKGMDQAKSANEMHAYNELRAAYEDLVF